MDAVDTDDGDDEGGGADDDLLISATKVSLRMDTFLPQIKVIEVTRVFGPTKTGLCKIPRFNSGSLLYPFQQ